MADDELDSLYSARPEDFTARRTELAAAAKRRGDATAATRISAARKPTTAAWIVNRLALADKDANRRLADLGDRLRAAHTSMDGERIRDLSVEQHKLINELSRAAIERADVDNPSSAIRDDVTGTLQAAIADPEVRARLGRLAKAERWSGFGAFGDAAPVSTGSRSGKAKAEPIPEPTRRLPQAAKKPSRDKEAEAARRQLEKLKAAAAAAERDKADADGVRAQQQAEREAARRRRDEAHASLRDAERELSGAQDRYDKAKRASRVAAELLKEAKAQLKRGGAS